MKPNTICKHHASLLDPAKNLDDIFYVPVLVLSFFIFFHLAKFLQFGADFAVGIDIDPQAITAARHNATLNNIGPDVLQLYLVPGEEINSSSENNSTGFEGQGSYEPEASFDEIVKYDIVVANILLYPLLNLADQIVSFAKPGAMVALSGIITEQVRI